MEMLCIPIRRKYSSSRNRASSIASRGKGGLKRRREEVNAAPEQNADLFSSQEGSVTIDTGDDLTNYLKFCSTQTPIAEGHGCKDIGRPTIPLDRFRRRYFVLFKGLLLYYNYKSQYEIDRKNDLVSLIMYKAKWHRSELYFCSWMVDLHSKMMLSSCTA